MNRYSGRQGTEIGKETHLRKKEVNTFNWRSALQEFCIVIYNDLLAGSRGKEEWLVCQALPWNQGFNVAVNKQEGAVLAHLKQIEEAYRLNQERHFFVVQNLWILIVVCLIPKTIPPMHIFLLEVLPVPSQIRNSKVASSWNCSRDLTVMT